MAHPHSGADLFSPRESRSFSHTALPAAQHVSDPGPQRGRFVAGLRWPKKNGFCDGFCGNALMKSYEYLSKIWSFLIAMFDETDV